MAILECPILEFDYLARPGVVEVPIYLRQEPGKTESANSLDLRFACQPQQLMPGEFRPTACQHFASGSGVLWSREKTLWVNPGVNPYMLDGAEQFAGGEKVGCMFSVEVPPYKPPFPSIMGATGWGQAHVEDTKLSSPGNWADAAKWHVPCDGLAATVRVNSRIMYPGAYLLNPNAVIDATRVEKTYLRRYNAQWQQEEIPCTYKCGWLVLKPPPYWPWKIDLGRIVPVDPDGNPFEPFPIPTPSDV